MELGRAAFTLKETKLCSTSTGTESVLPKGHGFTAVQSYTSASLPASDDSVGPRDDRDFYQMAHADLHAHNPDSEGGDIRVRSEGDGPYRSIVCISIYIHMIRVRVIDVSYPGLA